MKAFLKDEFIRLVDKIPHTDPTTNAYHMLLHSIEALDAIGITIEKIITMAEEDLADPAPVFPFNPHPVPDDLEPIEGPIEAEPIPQPTPVTPIPEPIPVPTPIEPPEEPMEQPAETEPAETTEYTESEVRAALTKARLAGKDINAAMQKCGSENFQNVPKTKYAALIKELEVI